MYWYKPKSAKQLEFNEKLMIQISEQFQKAGIRSASPRRVLKIDKL
jgi:hypothetical protein